MRSLAMMNASVLNGSYNKNNLCLFGNVKQKTINTKTVYGPDLTAFIDVQTDFAGLVTQSGVNTVTTNGRLFVLSTIVSGVGSVACYSLSLTGGKPTPIGRINFNLPNSAATTHTPRFMRVVDNGTTGWKIYIGTIGSVAINGGVFRINKVDLSDFTFNPTPVQFYSALSTDIKGTYFLQDPVQLGALNLITTLMCGAYDSVSGQIITAKGTAASLSHDGFDDAVAPQVDDIVCTSPTVVSGTTFTKTAHGLQGGDPVVLKANAPGGFTQSTQLAAQTVYFVRAATLTANTFELSATTGGAAIVTTTAVTPTLVRAWGTSSNNYLNSRKTGTIATAFAGTALLLDNAKIATIADGPNAGVKCFFLPTTTNFYCWPLTSITNGATSLTGAAGINNTGTGVDYVAPANVAATYSEVLGKIIYSSAAFAFFIKPWANGQIDASFGTQINLWLENKNKSNDYFRGFVVSGVDVMNGVLYVAITTTGQRGILMIDLRSDDRFGYSYMTTPVTKIGSATLNSISTIEQLFDVTDNVVIQYRTALTASDPIFNTASGGWTTIETAEDLSAISVNGYVQLRVGWSVISYLSGIPAQLENIYLNFTPYTDISDNWLGWNDKTSRNGEAPAYGAFLQKTAYNTPVAMRFTAVDNLTGNIIVQADTDTNFSSFDKTSNSGSSWSAMTGANDYPNVALTSGIRYKWSGAVPSDVTISFKEK